MADPIIAALPARAALAIGLPAVAEMLVARPQVPVLIMPSGTVAMLPVRYGVQVTAAGEFAVTAVVVHVGVVEFAGVGAISAAALQVQARGVQFAGEGTFTASDTPRRFVEFAAAGGFAATGYAVYSATVEFAGVGAISAAALQVQARGVQFSGVGTLSATGVQVQTRGVQFAGEGTFGVSAMRVYSATVQLTGEGGFSAVGTIKKSYTDDFSRANGAIGSSWGPSSPQPVINTNAAQNSTSSGNTLQLVEYLGGMMLSDHYAVTVKIKTPVGTSRVTTTYFYVTARGNGTSTQNDDRVVLVASGDAWSSGIYTLSSGGTWTRRTTITNAFVSGDDATLEVNGNVYTAYRNGVAIGPAWTDSGGVVPTGVGRRGFGFGTQPINNGFGFAIDEITCTDL